MMGKLIARPQLTFTEALNEAKGKLTDWKGRSRRSEFWWCALAVFIASFVLGFIPLLGQLLSLLLALIMIPISMRRLHDTGRSGWWLLAMIVVSGAYSFIILNAMVSAIDGNTDRMLEKMLETIANPVTLILWLLSVILSITLLVFFCQDSKPEPNKWGDSPKYVEDDENFGSKAYGQSEFERV